MKAKHRKTLQTIFRTPTSSKIAFKDIEALFKALGGTVEEGRGSRVRLILGEDRLRMHRPHPGKEAKKYQVEELRRWLTERGIKP